MPPTTPSPHRFIVGQKRQPSPAKDKKASSALRRQVAQDVGEHTHTQLLGAQFVATPRFSAVRPNATSRTPLRHPSPTSVAFVDAIRRTTGFSHEDVDDAAQDPHDEEEMLDNEQDSALPTTEGSGPAAIKRRLSDVDFNGHTIDSGAAFRYSQSTASHLAKPAHRFALSPSSRTTIITDTPPNQARPHFLRPSAQPQESSEPLPEAFSPHRRGQKFMPGGMAATMQQWVLETGQAAAQSRRGQGYVRGDDFVFKTKAQGVAGDGPYLVRAKTVTGEVMRLLLVQGVEAREVTEGSIVGVRAPTWDVVIDSETWKVGVDWKILP